MAEACVGGRSGLSRSDLDFSASPLPRWHFAFLTLPSTSRRPRCAKSVPRRAVSKRLTIRLRSVHRYHNTACTTTLNGSVRRHRTLVRCLSEQVALRPAQADPDQHSDQTGPACMGTPVANACLQGALYGQVCLRPPLTFGCSTCHQDYGPKCPRVDAGERTLTGLGLRQTALPLPVVVARAGVATFALQDHGVAPGRWRSHRELKAGYQG